MVTWGAVNPTWSKIDKGLTGSPVAGGPPDVPGRIAGAAW